MANLKDLYTNIQKDIFPDNLTIILGEEKLEYQKRVWDIEGEVKGLRYGENPDQPAALYELKQGQISCGGLTWRGPGAGIVSSLNESQLLQSGKHPGKTNLTDVDNGANILQYLYEKPAAIIIKHNNPCGAATADNIYLALQNAFNCDQIAAFGGAIVINCPLSKEAAELIAANYFEVVAAPAFESGTLAIIKSRKNLRIMEIPGLAQLEKFCEASFLDIKSLADGGLILQKSFQNRILKNSDFMPAQATNKENVTVSAKMPNQAELDDLRFAWAIESGVSSNSVIFARNGATIAIGTGEQDRVSCVDIAIHKAYSRYADQLARKECQISWYELQEKARTESKYQDIMLDIQKQTQEMRGNLPGSVLISDGFFPFRDGIDTAIAQGVTAIAQPGGSLRDYEGIIACNQAKPQVGMVFTAQRSFKH